jgi:hypothetical protein
MRAFAEAGFHRLALRQTVELSALLGGQKTEQQECGHGNLLEVRPPACHLHDMPDE